MSMFEKTAPAVRQETRFVAVAEIIGVAAMLAVFGILHGIMPDKVPFDYRVILAGILGGGVAVLNFFLMGITVQKAVSMENQENAGRLVKASYSRRMLLQMGWVVIAIAAPCFQFAAGLVPLLIPGAAVKLRGFSMKSSK